MSDIQAGFYKAKAVAGGVAIGVTDKGKEYVQVELAVPDLNRQLSARLYFSGDAIPYSLEKLRAAGWDGRTMADLSSVGSKECTIEIKFEEYNGKQQMKVDIKSGGGGALPIVGKMTETQLRAFAARIDSMNKASGAGGGTTAAPKPKATEDQIPF